ncbi:hypothetical protein BX600DRAFT_516987 [Xylariales sp. PMI_506]|nr:hypothetical protein BX600DRAFT_516987 [Xylariales sp. PMI_506]
MPPLRSLLGLAAILISTGVASAQALDLSGVTLTPELVLAVLPSCSLPCVDAGIQAANCSTADETLLSECWCTNVELLTDLTDCAMAACTTIEDKGTFLYMQQAVCEAYPKESQTREIVTGCIVVIVLSIPIVFARCFSRWKYTGKLWSDDYMSIATLIMLLGICGETIESTKIGLGMHFWDLQLENISPLYKYGYTGTILYAVALSIGKIAILLLYQRVFEVSTGSSWYRWFIRIVLLAEILEGVIFTFLSIFRCHPISSVWDMAPNAQCLNTSLIAVTAAGLGMLGDVVLIIFPIFPLRKLQVSVAKRVGVIMLFAVASLGTIASIVRLVYLVNLPRTLDASWNNVPFYTWTLIEMMCVVICGSVPALRPLVVNTVPKIPLPRVSMSLTWKSGQSGQRSPKASAYSTEGGSTNYSAKHASYSYGMSPLSPRQGESVGFKVPEKSHPRYHAYDRHDRYSANLPGHTASVRPSNSFNESEDELFELQSKHIGHAV